MILWTSSNFASDARRWRVLISGHLLAAYVHMWRERDMHAKFKVEAVWGRGRWACNILHTHGNKTVCRSCGRWPRNLSVGCIDAPAMRASVSESKKALECLSMHERDPVHSASCAFVCSLVVCG